MEGSAKFQRDSANLGNTAHITPGSWVHMVAIGGTGMGALAALLQDLGYFVTGSDGPLYPPMSTFLKERKIPLATGYDATNLDASTWSPRGVKVPGAKAVPDLVIVGNAMSRTNVEAVRVEELLAQKKTTRMSHAQALAEFGIGDRRSFVVAGTHGKSTTTTVLAWALESLGRKPGFFIGGIPKNFGFGCRMGSGPVFASEGDEYDTAYWDKESKFLHYRPSWVLCTGIEFDHADIFADVHAIEKMFCKLVGKTREGWLLVDDESAPRPESVSLVAKYVAERNLALFRYGKSTLSQYRLIRSEAHVLPWKNNVRGTKLRIRSPELGEFEVFSPMTGEHNALNLLGVIGVLLASKEATTAAQLQEFLKSFEGIKRRQEEVVVTSDLIVIDDFAHHPTAIRETIRAIRDRYPTSKIAAFFEARSATSSRSVMAKDFAECFDQADAIFLSPPSKTNIPDAEKLDITKLASDIQSRPINRHKVMVLEKDVSLLAKQFRSWHQKTLENADPSSVRPPAVHSTVAPVVALVMSNGPFGGIHQMLATDAP